MNEKEVYLQSVALEAIVMLTKVMDELRKESPTITACHLTVYADSRMVPYWNLSGRVADTHAYSYGATIGQALANYQTKLDNPDDLRMQAEKLLARAAAIQGGAK